MIEAKCNVRGMIAPRVMCGNVIVGGKLCGYEGKCEHKTTIKESPKTCVGCGAKNVNPDHAC